MDGMSVMGATGGLCKIAALQPTAPDTPGRAVVQASTWKKEKLVSLLAEDHSLDEDLAPEALEEFEPDQPTATGERQALVERVERESDWCSNGAGRECSVL